MNIHEYQAKDLFRKYGVSVPLGIVIYKPEDATRAAKTIIEESGDDVIVVKAQIHAGGRGKAGGVKVVKGVQAAQKAADEIFGKVLVTPQTGPTGKKVQRLLIQRGIEIAQQLYLAVVTDRASGRIEIVASTQGGVEIEKVAAETPEKILCIPIDSALGLMPHQARRIAFHFGLQDQPYAEFIWLLTRFYELYVEEDCSLAEINPLVVTSDNHLTAIDAKVTLDNNAAFRHKNWDRLRDFSEENPNEIEAKKYDLSYIQLDGTIGCLVNGAGLAMATMDIIKHFGGEPANFLDVGGGASVEAVTAAFKIILRSPEVKGVFVNIFGGIMKCDIIAEGIVAATKDLGLKVPLVVRLEGTNVLLGRKILAESGLAISTAITMADGAQKIVELAGKQA
jgi:succinyl-CoA synthetase beta subunit